MHISLLIIILLVVLAGSGLASTSDAPGRGPVPIVELVRSSAMRSTIDTVDAVIRCVLHGPSDVVELRLGSAASLQAGSGSKMHVEHRLKLDEHLSDWVAVDSGYHRVSGLKPGLYNLRVQARYPGQAWGEELWIHLHVEREHAASWWTYAVVAILVIPSAWYVARFRKKEKVRRQKEDERIRADERRRIARDLHDDVGSGLARIIVLSDAVAANDDTNHAAATIAETAREVIESVRTIVWVMKSENDSVAAMLSYIRDRVSELMRDHGIAFTCDDELPGTCTMQARSRWNVMMCIKEIATNIVRHSKATAVRMHVSCQRGYLSIRITDNGIGFSTDDVEAGGGLIHIPDRMLEIGGTAGIGSRQDEGTNILLVVPTDQHERIFGDTGQ